MIKTNSYQAKMIETDLTSFKKTQMDFNFLKIQMEREYLDNKLSIFVFLTEDKEIINFLKENFPYDNIFFSKKSLKKEEKAPSFSNQINFTNDKTYELVKNHKFNFYSKIIRGGIKEKLTVDTLFSGKIKPLGTLDFSGNNLLIKLASIGGTLLISNKSDAIIDIDLDFDLGFSGEILFEGNNITEEILQLSLKYQKKFKKIHISKDTIGHQLKVY